MTDNELDYPRKLLLYYNRSSPEKEGGLMMASFWDKSRIITRKIYRELS